MSERIEVRDESGAGADIPINGGPLSPELQEIVEKLAPSTIIVPDYRPFPGVKQPQTREDHQKTDTQYFG